MQTPGYLNETINNSDSTARFDQYFPASRNKFTFAEAPDKIGKAVGQTKARLRLEPTRYHPKAPANIAPLSVAKTCDLDDDPLPSEGFCSRATILGLLSIGDRATWISDGPQKIRSGETDLVVLAEGGGERSAVSIDSGCSGLLRRKARSVVLCRRRVRIHRHCGLN